MASADEFPVDKEAARLIRLYAQAQREIARQVRLALAQGNLDRADMRRHQLAALTAYLDDTGVRTDPQARQLIQDAFDQSDQLTVTRLRKQGVHITDVTGGSFAGVNAEAIRAMQDSLQAALSDSRRVIGRQVNDTFARAGRDQVRLALLGAHGSPRAAAGAARQQILADGVTGFIDRTGRQWSLADYTDMAIRTTTRQAVVEAAKLRMANHGVSLARVTTHASSCPVCLPWEGRLVSLDGATSILDGEPVATIDALPNGGPPMHPRCRHSLMPVVPAVDRLARELGVAA